MLLFLDPFSPFDVLMTHGGRGGRQRKSENRTLAFGAGTKTGRWSAGRRSARPAGFANLPDFWAHAPRGRDSQARPLGARQRSRASSVKGSRKPLAPPGAPFPFET